VAVPAPQHSPILGQLPLSQMVWSLCSSTSDRTWAYSFPVGSLTRSQSGFFGLGSAGITGSSIITQSKRNYLAECLSLPFLNVGHFSPIVQDPSRTPASSTPAINKAIFFMACLLLQRFQRR